VAVDGCDAKQKRDGRQRRARRVRLSPAARPHAGNFHTFAAGISYISILTGNGGDEHEHQVEQLRAGAEPNDLIEPARLTPLTRSSLKHAFRTVARVQRGIAVQFGFSAR